MLRRCSKRASCTIRAHRLWHTVSPLESCASRDAHRLSRHMAVRVREEEVGMRQVEELLSSEI